MGHALLQPPVRRFEGRIRLPLIQHPGEATVQQLQSSMVTQEAIKFARTTAMNRKAIYPLPAIQRFIVSGPGYPNTPESMASGLRARNARRLVNTTRGASAGIA